MTKSIREKLEKGLILDPELVCSSDEVNATLGHNPDYLLDIHGITKNELIRLERNKLALKARYVVEATGEHRVRWIIFKEALQ